MTCSLTALDASTLDRLAQADADEFLELTETLEGSVCYVDKAWHGLHFLFTGTAWEGRFPACFLLAGGQQVGDEDQNSRLYRPEEVSAIAAWLSGVTRATLSARFDPAEMSALAIYPEIWERDPAEDDTLGYLLGFFDEMQAALAEAHRRQLGLLIGIS